MKLLIRAAIVLAALLVIAWLFMPQMLSLGVPKHIASLGPAAANIYKNPDKVDIYRLHQDKGLGGVYEPVTVITDRILEGHLSPSRDWISRFRAWADSDPNGEMPMCEPDPGFVIRLTRGKDSIDYVLCLHCSQYTVQNPGEPLKSWGSFAPTGGVIVPLLSEVYPQDADLRELSDAYKKHE